ncbi:hypothetical protein [Candidatus Lokiarchaeum ossiferum]|uniref:hypothetical protein n=1 Tax=Candidatus Lokiarchaeum ossiferum TaxID=2951803 RepID=UPI00352EDFE1
MIKIQWEIYKGKELCILDYRNTSVDEIKIVVQDVTTQVLQSSKKDICFLVNLEGLNGNKEILETFKVEGKKTEDVTKKTAVLGITGIKKVLFTAYNRFTGGKSRIFSSGEEAKDWLLSS